MASYLATFKMFVTFLNPWNLIYLDLFVQTHSMFCFAFSHLERPPAIIYGKGLTTSYLGASLPTGDITVRRQLWYAFCLTR